MVGGGTDTARRGRLKRLHEERQKALRDLAAAVDAANPEDIEEDLPVEKEEEPQEVDEEL